RPLTNAEQAKRYHTIVACLDDYSVILETPRGPREFQFDKIFNPECTQEEVFTESNAKKLIFPRLIQCAIDGFNVCIFAYGHTGSGKTFTMVGDRDRRNPGIIPRTFTKIFEIIQDNESKFEFKVHLVSYMLELYNERLQDLFVSPTEAFSKRIEIKRDRKGLYFNFYSPPLLVQNIFTHNFCLGFFLTPLTTNCPTLCMFCPWRCHFSFVNGAASCALP
uniref:Si:dkey-96l17.6 n=1 Tax=Sinocyclocheilus anshuiensis TaxID=1608454 RepID=A0A671KKK0_9TELE